MGYLWLKSLHIVAVIVWISGMLFAAIMIAVLSPTRAGSDALSRPAILDKVRRWDRAITSPAMLLVWVFGLAMTYAGGWFTTPWLMLKLVFVLLLSAFHGLLSGTLRRLARTETPAVPSILSYAPATIILGVLAIVSIVVIKPW